MEILKSQNAETVKLLIELAADKMCFSLQVDGSLDKYGVENKIITARFISENRESQCVSIQCLIC